ncbi:MAG: VTT domain-containing protein [Nanoarchaeota archaeon]
MTDYNFIQENSHTHKIWTLISSIIILLIILIISIFFSTFFYQLLYSLPYFENLVLFLTDNIKNVTLWGLFLAHLIGGIFFVPSPDEIIFYYGLLKGNNYFLALIFSTIGYMISQVLNYYAGKKISPLIMHIISKKKVYEGRRFVNKYGSVGIFLFNFLPFPGPLLTFALGIARYNFARLFTLTLLGKICKYITLILIFYLISA